MAHTTEYTAAHKGLLALRDATVEWAFTMNDMKGSDWNTLLTVDELNLFDLHVERLERGDLSPRELFELGALVGQFAHMTSCRLKADGGLMHREFPVVNPVAAAVAVMQQVVLDLWPVAVA